MRRSCAMPPTPSGRVPAAPSGPAPTFPAPALLALSLLALCWLSPAPAVRAQTDAPAGSGGASASDPLANIFRDTEEVHVVDVEVVVTDADDRPVDGLTRDDFEILEDGRPVEISNFFAVAAGRPTPLAGEAIAPEAPEPASGEPPRQPAETTAAPLSDFHLAVFVDNVQTRAIHRNRMLERLEDYLTESWRPGMAVMLVTNERGLRIRLPFSSRREQVLSALGELREESVRGSRLEQDLEQLMDAIQHVNVEAGSGLVGTKAGMYGPSRMGNPTTLPEDELFDIDSQEVVTAEVASEAKGLIPQLMAYAQQRDDEVLGSLAVLSRLVRTLSGLSGRKAILHVSDGLSVNPSEAIFEAYDRHFEPLSRVPGVVGLINETGRYDLQDSFTALADLANAGRVGLYMLDASPPEALRPGGADQGTSFRGTRFASTEERNEQEPLRFLARETGGRASLSNVTLESTLGSFFGDFEHYYSLGYQAQPEPGRKRGIEVRLKQPRRDGGRLTVRHRLAVRDRTPEERMTERTLAALVLGTLHNPLQVTIETQPAEPAGDGNFVVPVIVRIPLGKLVLVPGAREHQARVSMYVAVVDERGRTSEVMREVCPIRIPNAELLVALGRHAGCGVRLLMRPGAQQVAVAVRDELSARDSAVRLELEVGAESGDGSADATRASR